MAIEIVVFNLDAVLSGRGRIEAAFDDVIASNEARHARRNVVRGVLDELGVEPSSAAAVACGPIDLYEALGARCEVIIGVATSGYPAWELRRHPHTAIARSIAEAVDLITAQPQGSLRAPACFRNDHGSPG